MTTKRGIPEGGVPHISLPPEAQGISRLTSLQYRQLESSGLQTPKRSDAVLYELSELWPYLRALQAASSLPSGLPRRTEFGVFQPDATAAGRNGNRPSQQVTKAAAMVTALKPTHGGGWSSGNARDFHSGDARFASRPACQLSRDLSWFSKVNP
jgi:hypothetical protein